MTSSQHHQLVTSLLLFLTLMLSTWPLSETMTSKVSGRQDNSLMEYGSKSMSTAVKDRKSERKAAVVVGGSTSDLAKSFTAPWCRNDSCLSPELDPADEQPGRVQPPDDRPAPADNEREDVIDLMRSVSEELSGLRTALQHLRVDSQAVHRQIKRLHRSSCTATRRARRRTRWTASSEKNRRLPDTGTSTVTSFLAAIGGEAYEARRFVLPQNLRPGCMPRGVLHGACLPRILAVKRC